MSVMPSLETLHWYTALVGTSARHGQPPALHGWPGAYHPPPFPPNWPMHGGALLQGGAAIIRRHPHVFLVEPGGAAWCLSGALPRSGGGKGQGRRAGAAGVPGPVTFSWSRAVRFMPDAVRRAAVRRAGADPVPGDPNTYALPHGNLAAAWVRWTGQDEAGYMARHVPPCTPGPEDEPMHRLEAQIARDALEVEASRAAVAVMDWIWQDRRPRPTADKADAAARTACARLDAAASRLRAAGGSPGPVLAGVASAYRRLDPTGYIAHRLALGAGVELSAMKEEAA